MFEGWQTAGLNALCPMQWRQTAGGSAGTAKAYERRAWWKLPRRILDGFKGFKRLKAGKRQA